MDKYAEMIVLVPVTQFVKVEAAAKEDSRSLKSTASFLLSKWVLATSKRRRATSSTALRGRRTNTKKTGK